MESRKYWLKNPLVIASLGCVLAFAAACGDDDDTSNPAPSGGSKATGGTSSTAGKNTGGTSSTAGTKATAGDGNTDTGGGGAGGGGQVGEGGDAGSGGAPASCTDDADMGCYSCKPKTLTQFLNACPTTGCEPFDNSQLTSISAGVLPDLP